MNHRWKRGKPHKLRVEIQQNVMHGRIETDGDVLDILPSKAKVCLALLRDLNVLDRAFFTFLLFLLFLGRIGSGNGFIDKIVETFNNVIAHALKTIRSGHVKRNTGHDILAVLALGIHHRYRIDNLHGGQIAKVSCHRGRPHVNGYTVSFLYLARTESDDFPVVPDADRNTPFSITKCGR